MKTFLLYRPDDYLTHTRVQILKTTLKWLVLLWLGAVCIRMLCFMAYMSQGLNPQELTRFGGDPTTRSASGDTLQQVLFLLLWAPLAEELMFRLGLSFRRRTVALWAGLLPFLWCFYLNSVRQWYILVPVALLGALFYFLITRYTTPAQWKVWRSWYIIPAMWVSAVGFGLVHFHAFSVLNGQVFPWALCTVLVPMSLGFAATYARVNLGFWWGVLLHSLFNIPAILTLILS